MYTHKHVVKYKNIIVNLCHELCMSLIKKCVYIDRGQGKIHHYQ